MKLKKIKHTRLYEKIVKQLKEKIANGEYGVGDKLPAERELIETFGVSNAAVREAFRVLESEGLIVSRAGGGRFVRAAHPDTLFRTDGGVCALECSKILELLEARETIECKIASLAAKHAVPEDIEKLKEIIERIEQGFGDSEKHAKLFEIDGEFHKVLGEACRNFVLKNWLDLSLELLKNSRQKALQGKYQERERGIVEELRQILAAIEKRDAKAAAIAMRKHLRNIKRTVK